MFKFFDPGLTSFISSAASLGTIDIFKVIRGALVLLAVCMADLMKQKAAFNGCSNLACYGRSRQAKYLEHFDTLSGCETPTLDLKAVVLNVPLDAVNYLGRVPQISPLRKVRGKLATPAISANSYIECTFASSYCER